MLVPFADITVVENVLPWLVVKVGVVVAEDQTKPDSVTFDPPVLVI
jgi:hypothetical protein